ncbi:MAG: hypothetical protein IPM69_18940 [Ignavibacteria bacterium]|nr:hypothetical protein [Ignavibacteria bacterium]
MKNLILFLLFCFTFFPASAQHENDNWYLGSNGAQNSGITFQYGPPISVQYAAVINSRGRGSASISDKTTGNLLFYTDGEAVMNRNQQIMKNGRKLNGGSQYSVQNSIIVPDPGNNLQYYIFTIDDHFSNLGLCYSVVSLQDPDGEVISKNNLLLKDVIGKVVGTRDCSGDGFWVVTHSVKLNTFYSFHITATGINMVPVVSTYTPTTTIPTYSPYMEYAWLKISPNGAKLAINPYASITGFDYGLDLFDFNALTGEVTNRKVLHIKEFGTPAFSPDNSNLYSFYRETINSRIYLLQYDINFPDEQSIRNSVRIIDSNSLGGELQLAPDGKIYSDHINLKYFGAIEKPNLKGKACSYRESVLVMPEARFWDLPNLMDYNMGHSSDTAIICLNNTARIGPPPFSGFSYSWTPAIGLDNPTIAQPLASPPQTSKYTLTVTNTNGCQSTQTYIVVIADKPKITPVAPLCLGNFVQLSASGGDTYQWFPAESVDTATKSNPITKPKVSTLYKVITTRGQCTDSAFVYVEVIAPIAKAGADKTTCIGGSVQLGDSEKIGESYTWLPTDGLNNSILSNPIATPTKSTQYILEVWKNGCTAFDTVLVTVIGKTKAVVSGDTAICGAGSSVILVSSGGSEYEWFPTTGLDNPRIANPRAFPIVTTRYKVIVSNGDCKDSAFVTVNVIPFGGANAGTDKTVCPGGTAELGEKPTNGQQYNWQPTNNLDDPTKANPTFTATGTGKTEYILTVTNSLGCTSLDTVVVTVGNIIAKVSSDTSICSGSSVQLLARGGANYTWTPSTGLSNPNIENPIASPNTTTTYKVIVSSGTCEDSTFITITVNPQPTANAGLDKTLCLNASTVIGEAAQAGFTYSWQPTTGLDDATKSNPIASPTTTTQYILTVTGNGGCTSSDFVIVTIGTIKAIVSNDTSICEGASAKLFSSGAAKYEWSPSTGLDNPSIANPIANPTSTMKYKVLVSSGTCIDSGFVTVTILPLPNTNAGSDTTICLGASTEIGTPAEAGNSYSWNPITGLSSPTASQTTASPATTTTYTLQVTNPAGCVKSDEVTVTVNPRNARSFTLQPDTVSILPGKQFSTSLEIPSGVADWSLKLKYDPLLITYNSITGTQASSDDLKGELLISGNGGSRSIPITFDAFLPHTSDTIYPVKLSVDTSKAAECETWSAVGNILMLADYCGKNIRVVSSTGKKYFLTVKDKSIDFGVGLSGNVRLEVFDYVGNSVLVVSDGILEAGEYSAGLDLPVGVYYCRMRAGMFESVGKVLVRF